MKTLFFSIAILFSCTVTCRGQSDCKASRADSVWKALKYYQTKFINPHNASQKYFPLLAAAYFYRDSTSDNIYLHERFESNPSWLTGDRFNYFLLIDSAYVVLEIPDSGLVNDLKPLGLRNLYDDANERAKDSIYNFNPNVDGLAIVEGQDEMIFFMHDCNAEIIDYNEWGKAPLPDWYFPVVMSSRNRSHYYCECSAFLKNSLVSPDPFGAIGRRYEVFREIRTADEDLLISCVFFAKALSADSVLQAKLACFLKAFHFSIESILQSDSIYKSYFLDQVNSSYVYVSAAKRLEFLQTLQNWTQTYDFLNQIGALNPGFPASELLQSKDTAFKVITDGSSPQIKPSWKSLPKDKQNAIIEFINYTEAMNIQTKIAVYDGLDWKANKHREFHSELHRR